MTLKFDLLIFSLYKSMHQNWQKCFKILTFQTKKHINGVTLIVRGDGLDVRW